MRILLTTILLLLIGCGGGAPSFDETKFEFMEGYYEGQWSNYGVEYIDIEEFREVYDKAGNRKSFEVHGYVDINRYYMGEDFSVQHLRFGTWHGVFLKGDYEEGEFVDFHANLEYKHYLEKGVYEWREHPIYKRIHMRYERNVDYIILIIDYLDPKEGMLPSVDIIVEQHPYSV